MARPLAYGLLRLKPSEFDELTITEFYEMADGASQYEESKHRSMAWWVANIMVSSGNYKHGIDIEKLVKPFIKTKTKAEKETEKEAFFDDFFKQREGVVNGRSGG